LSDRFYTPTLIRPSGLPHIKTVMDIPPYNMSDFDFGRCDGHHEMVDLRLRKKQRLAA